MHSAVVQTLGRKLLITLLTREEKVSVAAILVVGIVLLSHELMHDVAVSSLHVSFSFNHRDCCRLNVAGCFPVEDFESSLQL